MSWMRRFGEAGNPEALFLRLHLQCRGMGKALGAKESGDRVKKYFFAVMLLTAVASAQIYTGTPVLTTTGQAVANASISVCSVNPGSSTPPSCGTGNYAQTYTDQTF